MPVKTLIEFGLSEKEAKIYLALLELEAAGVNHIAKKTGINRSTVYVVIESLKKRGLVSMTPDKKIQQYIAVSPETLLHVAQEKSQKALHTQKKIEEFLPELRALHKETQFKPKVVIYEGDEAVKKTYYSEFDSPDEFRVYKDLTGMLRLVPDDYVKNDVSARKKKKIKLFMISPNTSENQEIVQQYKANKSLDELVLIPEKKFSKSGRKIGIGIYKDRVKFSSAKEKIAIFIINEAIANTLRDLFDLAFEESKRLTKSKT